jgi:hypothetical protein
MRAKATIGAVGLALMLALVACSDDGEPSKTDGAVADQSTTIDTATTEGAPPADGGNPYNTASAINAYLDGKTVVMEGSNIPSHPNGYDENVNYGAATQCYKKTTMQIAAGVYTVTSELGTLENAPNQGDTGTCNHDVKSNEMTFASTTALVENVASDGSCFDFTVTYTGFQQEGRGYLSADGKQLVLELYFKDQATGHRCADGAVGSSGVTVNANAFTGDAKQVYAVQ